jgi:CRISPR-associated exonuclease Cas4
MFTEDQLAPISALQHFVFCERQCALIHVERLWAENRFTVEGQHLHRKAHSVGRDARPGVVTARGLILRSFRLGIVGMADVVELRGSPRLLKQLGIDEGRQLPSSQTTNEPTSAGASVTPVEYKRGKPKTNDSDRVQLCAQALCLEEMLGIGIPSGAIFYGLNRRRTEVVFDDALRTLTERVAKGVHAQFASGRTPIARREPKCEHCSLIQLCMPDAVTVARSMAAFNERSFRQHLQTVGPSTDSEHTQADAN